MPELQEIVEEVAALLGMSTTLESRHFRLLAFAAQPEAADPVRLETILGRGSSPSTRAWFEGFGIASATGPVHIPADPERGLRARLCLPARSRGVVHGYIWAIHDLGGEVTTGPSEEAVAEAMLLARQAGEALARRTRSRRETTRLVHDLIQAPAGATEAPARALAVDTGLRLDQPVVAAVLGSPDPSVILAPAVFETPGILPRTAAVAADGPRLVLALAVPARGVHDTLAKARAHAQRHLSDDEGRPVAAPRVVAGVGGVRPGLEELRASWAEATQAWTAAVAAPALHDVADWTTLGIDRLLGGSAATEVVAATRTPPIQRLLDEGGAELVRTALLYLDAAGSMARTAAELGLHRQSVYHRLQRIESITGLDLDSGRDRLELHLGLTMARAVGAGPDDDRSGRR
ncbi:PucR family transcriptional regulator [Janibacter sp. G56]|uniref:PucR family transcriptional regulator n=1 Tax=Janibacter sp. G56 TaxID=3418717 RepID=UPI003CFE03CF